MRYLNKTLIILASVALFSCSPKLVPFTTDVQKNLADVELSKVQFYISNDIVLYKTTEKNQASIENGKVVVLNRKNSESIVIRKNTPCILEGTLNSKNLIVSFELGAGRYLSFGTDSTGYFSLMAQKWQGKKGILKYAHNLYTTESGGTLLMIEMKALKRMDSRYKIVCGRKL